MKRAENFGILPTVRWKTLTFRRKLDWLLHVFSSPLPPVHGYGFIGTTNRPRDKVDMATFSLWWLVMTLILSLVTVGKAAFFCNWSPSHLPVFASVANCPSRWTDSSNCPNFKIACPRKKVCPNQSVRWNLPEIWLILAEKNISKILNIIIYWTLSKIFVIQELVIRKSKKLWYCVYSSLYSSI